MKTRSLRRQFTLWTIFLVVVPSLLIMAIYTTGRISNARQQSLALISQQVASDERLIEYWLSERMNDVRTISRSESFRVLDPRRMQRKLEESQRINKNFDSLSYIDKDGNFRFSTLSGGIRFPSAAGQPYYQAALAGKEYISEVVVGRNSGLPIINFSAPVYDYAGNFQGLILGSVRLTLLESLLHNTWIGETGEVFIVDKNGVMLTEPRRFDALSARGLVRDTARMNVKISEDAARNIHLGQTGTATWTDYLGERVIGAYQATPDRSWTVIGKINETEVFAPMYRQLANMAGGTFLLLILLTQLATTITDRVKQPIAWLIAQSNLVAAEDYRAVGRDFNAENMSSEMVSLCQTFIAMSRKIELTVSLLKQNENLLHAKIAEIQRINAALEEKILEQQAAEEHRQRYAEEIAATNRELQSFTNIVAHDFRSPLVNLKGFSQELTRSLAQLTQALDSEAATLSPAVCAQLAPILEKELPEDLEFINTAVDRLDRMVNALLKLARAGRRDLTYHEVDAGELVQGVLRTFDHQLSQQGIQVDVGPLPVIETDTLALEQIIANLVDNAIKYLDPARPGKIAIAATPENGCHLFSVKDNGCGVAAGDQEKIFDIFRRVGRQDIPGEGLGLAYVRALVRQLGGKVWCESEPGDGTTIFFTLPPQPPPAVS
jgi:signal transduction histidine kinase